VRRGIKDKAGPAPKQCRVGPLSAPLPGARVREVLPLLVPAGGTTAMGVFGGCQLNEAAGATSTAPARAGSQSA
jgi:hypothetical protein